MVPCNQIPTAGVASRVLEVRAKSSSAHALVAVPHAQSSRWLARRGAWTATSVLAVEPLLTVHFLGPRRLVVDPRHGQPHAPATEMYQIDYAQAAEDG